MAADEPNLNRTYEDLILSKTPIAYWRMELDEAGHILNRVQSTHSALGTPIGEVKTAPGPQAPTHPGFGAEKHSALEIPHASGHIEIDDPGNNSMLDFHQGDAITIEAWVSPYQLSGYRYILGKGRTGRDGFPAENQNYALRLAARGELSFLYRSVAEDGSEQYHRWTSSSSIAAGDGWHHLAVTYTFGEKGSLRGYMDGEAVQGKWDMGGDTGAPPVVDNDQLWIGSALGASPTSTFCGGIDEVALYRSILAPEDIQARYTFEPRPPELDVRDIPDRAVLVQIFEGVSGQSFSSRSPRLTSQYTTDAFAFSRIPHQYNERGIQVDRSSPFMIHAHGFFQQPPGPLRILVRARNGARLFIDDQLVLSVPFFNISSTAHGKVFEVERDQAPNIRLLRRGDQEVIVDFQSDGKPHRMRFEMIVGAAQRRPELGETAVCVAAAGDDFRVVSQLVDATLTDQQWPGLMDHLMAKTDRIDRENRERQSVEETRYWKQRHAEAQKTVAQMEPLALPENVLPQAAYNEIDRFINDRLISENQQPMPLVDDHAFLRRLSLDTIGTIAPLPWIEVHLKRPTSDVRVRLVDQLLQDDRWADHWTAYWQDVLAENPNIVNPTLNNTGPFRWWIHESLVDNKPLDRFVTELVMMEGSSYYGGPAGFAMATQNDAPLAAKAHILGQAFLGIQMQCARCHDAPFHDWTQHDLFSIAAMLNRSAQTVPVTSTVPMAAAGTPPPRIPITLKPGARVEPVWPFPELGDSGLSSELTRSTVDTRAEVAERITGPGNLRFAEVLVNRLWKRTMGYPLVAPVEDWENATISHPRLLDFLAREFIAHGYDAKHIARLIFNSHSYQRRAVDLPDTGIFLFAGPATRRMTAEQLVDSLFVASGRPFDAGPMNIDIDGARSFTASLNLGTPRRAWQFASLSNERDRPSLSLPFAQPFSSTMEIFGWNGSRQNPINDREQQPNVLQAAILNNGILLRDNVRLSLDSELTALAVEAKKPAQLVQQTFLRILGRPPTPTEQTMFKQLISQDFSNRVVKVSDQQRKRIEQQISQLPRNLVSWSNHLSPEANEIKIALRQAITRGPIPTPQLTTDWRERMEDMVWVLFNSPEFIYIR